MKAVCVRLWRIASWSCWNVLVICECIRQRLLSRCGASRDDGKRRTCRRRRNQFFLCFLGSYTNIVTSSFPRTHRIVATRHSGDAADDAVAVITGNNQLSHLGSRLYIREGGTQYVEDGLLRALQSISHSCLLSLRASSSPCPCLRSRRNTLS